MTRRRSGVRVAYRPPHSSTVTLGATASFGRGISARALVFAAFAGYDPFVSRGPADLDGRRVPSQRLGYAGGRRRCCWRSFSCSSCGRSAPGWSPIVLLGTAVFGLVHYRQTLEHCDRRRLLVQALRRSRARRELLDELVTTHVTGMTSLAVVAWKRCSSTARSTSSPTSTGPRPRSGSTRSTRSSTAGARPGRTTSSPA